MTRGVIGRRISELPPIKGVQYLVCEKSKRSREKGELVVVGRYLRLHDAEIRAYNDHMEGYLRFVVRRNSQGPAVVREYAPEGGQQALVRINNAFRKEFEDTPLDLDAVHSVIWKRLSQELIDLLPALSTPEIDDFRRWMNDAIRTKLWKGDSQMDRREAFARLTEALGLQEHGVYEANGVRGELLYSDHDHLGIIVYAIEQGCGCGPNIDIPWDALERPDELRAMIEMTMRDAAALAVQGIAETIADVARKEMQE